MARTRRGTDTCPGRHVYDLAQQNTCSDCSGAPDSFFYPVAQRLVLRMPWLEGDLAPRRVMRPRPIYVFRGTALLGICWMAASSHWQLTHSADAALVEIDAIVAARNSPQRENPLLVSVLNHSPRMVRQVTFRLSAPDVGSRDELAFGSLLSAVRRLLPGATWSECWRVDVFSSGSARDATNLTWQAKMVRVELE